MSSPTIQYGSTARYWLLWVLPFACAGACQPYETPKSANKTTAVEHAVTAPITASKNDQKTSMSGSSLKPIRELIALAMRQPRGAMPTETHQSYPIPRV